MKELTENQAFVFGLVSIAILIYGMAVTVLMLETFISSLK